MPNSTTEIDIFRSVSFSGYRATKLRHSINKNGGDYSHIEEDIRSAVTQFIDRGYDTFITGGADGFDLLATKVILSLRFLHKDIKLVMAVPFLGQEASYSEQDREFYEQSLESADPIEIISYNFHSRAYLDRNDFMLANSSQLICYFDGQRGGTMYTYNRAKRLSMGIVNLAPTAITKGEF